MSDPIPQTTTIRVTDADELRDALSMATAGETIRLADGDYGALSLDDTFDSTVTLQAETLHGARLTGLRLDGAANIAFDGLHLDYVAAPGTKINEVPFEINKSSGITITNSLFEGDEMDAPENAGHGYPTGRGLRIARSEDVLIENNEMRTFWKAINAGWNTDLILRGNDIHDVRSDGINITRSDGVLIEGNHIHDFRGNMDTGDHADMIQMYSAHNGIVPRNIVIRDNLLDMGDGTPAHGMLLHHTAGAMATHGNDVAFENVVITGNVLINGHTHGINLSATNGAVVSDNVLVSPPDYDGKPPRLTVSENSVAATITGNLAHNIDNFDGWNDAPTDWTTADNLAIQNDAPDLPNHYSALFVNAMSGVTGALGNLTLKPDGPAAAIGAGAPMLYHDPAPETLTALATSERGDLLNVVTFDAGMTAGPAGPAAGEGTFEWDFGDGSTGSGVAPRHVYTEPGIYNAVLTVTLPDGTSDKIKIVTMIRAADMVYLDAATGEMILQDNGTETTLAVAPDDTPGDGFAMDYDTKIWLPQHHTTALAGAESVTVSARVSAEKHGTLLGADNAFIVQIDKAGELRVRLQDAASDNWFVTDGAGLLDGAVHDIAVAFDGRAGTLTLTVDGAATVHDAPMTEIASDITDEIKIGALKGRGGSFTGTLEAFDLDVNSVRYDLSGTTVVDSATDEVGPDERTSGDAAHDDEHAAPEEDGSSAPEPGTTGRMESGTVKVAQDGPEQWHTVVFGEAIPEARVVMGPVGGGGADPVVSRVRDVTETGFQFQLDEWDYLDGTLPEATVSWVAGTAGTHVLATGQTVSFGRTTAADDTPVEVALEAFDAAPAVFGQVTSANDAAAVTHRLSNVSADGFDLRLQEEEAADQVHAIEQIDWLAVADDPAGPIEIVQNADRISDEPGEISFAAAGSPLPVLLADMQTERGSNTAALRIEARGGSDVTLRVEEEQSRDSETWHYGEDVVGLAMAETALDLFAPAKRMEVGTYTFEQSGRDVWHTVDFAATIEDARVVMGPVASDEPDPATVRVRNVTDSGFEFQIDEWDYQDGVHGPAHIGWMAMSAGTHTLSTGEQVTAGRVVASDYDPVSVSLDGFDTAPTVLAQVSSDAGWQSVTTRLSEVGQDGFELRMQEQENRDNGHLAETVDWIAVDDAAWRVREAELDDSWQRVAEMGDDTAVFAAMQTERDSDPATLEYRVDATTRAVSMRIAEEISADAETDHVAEVVDVFVLNEGLYDLSA